MRIDQKLTSRKLVPKIERLFALSGRKILSLEKSWKPQDGAPVFTVKGKYTARGWTEWTQGFQFGSALLQFDATGDERFLEIGRRNTIERMAPHVSHIGVHDHGFNNISTYGNLLRLIREGKIPFDEREKDFCELALKVSGAVQAARWTRTAEGGGFIYSFNGPHSLFIDTMRSLRSLAVAHQLGHVLMGERDQKISLRQRLIEHAATTARFTRPFSMRTMAGIVAPIRSRAIRLSAPGRAGWRGRSSVSPSNSNSLAAASGRTPLTCLRSALYRRRPSAVCSPPLPSERCWLAPPLSPPISTWKTVAPTAFPCGTPGRRICTGWAPA